MLVTFSLMEQSFLRSEQAYLSGLWCWVHLWRLGGKHYRRGLPRGEWGLQKTGSENNSRRALREPKRWGRRVPQLCKGFTVYITDIFSDLCLWGVENRQVSTLLPFFRQSKRHTNTKINKITIKNNSAELDRYKDARGYSGPWQCDGKTV